MPTPRMYMHDVLLKGGYIISEVCTGPDCEYCANDPQAAIRAQNVHFMPRTQDDRNDNPHRSPDHKKRGKGKC